MKKITLIPLCKNRYDSKNKILQIIQSHFILIVHLLTLCKLSADIQSHVKSVSVNIQQKCLLTVSMFGGLGCVVKGEEAIEWERHTSTKTKILRQPVNQHG